MEVWYGNRFMFQTICYNEQLKIKQINTFDFIWSIVTQNQT